MAILSIGYDGTVDEKQWTKIHASTASVYGVSTPDSWKVMAVAGSDRTVSIAAGSGWGHHVFDESDTNYTLQGDTVASGSRWDMVVLRRDWGPIGGGPSSFQLVKGASAKTLPRRANEPGVLDEQPLALVQFTAGQTQPTTIIDLRCWASNGGVEVVDQLALSYLETPGAAVKLGPTVWRYEPLGNGVWGWSGSNGATLAGSTGWEVQGDVTREVSSMAGANRYRMGMKLKRTAGTLTMSSAAGWTRLTGSVLPSGSRPAQAVDVVVSLSEGVNDYGGIGILRIEPGGQVAYLPLQPTSQSIKKGSYFNIVAEWVG